MEGFGWIMTIILGGLGLLGQLIVAVAGACILILAYRAFQGRSA